MQSNVTHLPQFTSDAKKRWNQIPKEFRDAVLNNVYCGNCRTGSSLHLRDGKMAGTSLVLQGVCKKCGGEVARVIETDE